MVPASTTKCSAVPGSRRSVTMVPQPCMPAGQTRVDEHPQCFLRCRPRHPVLLGQPHNRRQRVPRGELTGLDAGTQGRGYHPVRRVTGTLLVSHTMNANAPYPAPITLRALW